MDTTFANKLEAFRLRVETDQIDRYHRSFPGGNEELCRHATVTKIKSGTKYYKVDVGDSGKYMVEVATGNIFGIKGRGQVHKGHFYGTLDTIADYFWGEYHPQRLSAPLPTGKWGYPKLTFAPKQEKTVQAEPENLDEQQRRDEKNGLYPQHIDQAN